MADMPPFSASAREFQERFFRENPSLRELAHLMKTVPDASFFVKDAQCRYVLCNAFHLALYDLRHEDELIGKRTGDFFPDLLAQAYEADDRRVLTSGESLWNEVWLVPQIHGIPRWVSSSKTPLRDLRGNIMGLAGLMRPIATPEHQDACFQELQHVIEFLERTFVDEVTVKRLAEIAGTSTSTLHRRFRQMLRLSPMQYVESLRIHEAQRLLATTDKNIGQIAAAVGFYDQSYFNKRFRKWTGMTPLAFRKQFQRDQ